MSLKRLDAPKGNPASRLIAEVINLQTDVAALQAEDVSLDARITVLETTSTIEARTDDPVGPTVGRIWLRTDL